MDDIEKRINALIANRYLYGDEKQLCDIFHRVAKKYTVNDLQYKRMKLYMNRRWFIPSTPILSNGGTDRGLPISCYVFNVDDTLYDIVDSFKQFASLGARGGGVGLNWSDVRSIGEKIDGRGRTSGIIPFIKVNDSTMVAVSQGSLRRGACAVYLDVSHPEIEEFIRIRQPRGDANRNCLNIHHGINITDDFMEAVIEGEDWNLIDPKTKAIIKTVNARVLFQDIIEIRLSTGEPYIVFIDTVNRNICESHRKLGLKVRSSNLCSEILLPTGKDHLGKQRTAVCCLGSVNLEHYDSFKEDEEFIPSCIEFLDRVLDDFIGRADAYPEFKDAVYSAKRERSIGLGAMGLHSLFLKKELSFADIKAKSLNIEIFSHIQKQVSKADAKLSKLYGVCLDSEEAKTENRFSYKIAIAPTASISIVGGGVSPSIEPFTTNIFVHKSINGSQVCKNKYLESVLSKKGKDTEDVWDSILANYGSVSHLEFLSCREKEIFKTSFEIDPLTLIDQAGDRAEFIDQGQSINLFLPPTISKLDLLNIYITAWKSGIKSLYYCRSFSIQRPSIITNAYNSNTINTEIAKGNNGDSCNSYEECLSCT